LENALAAATAAGDAEVIKKAAKAVHDNRAQHFNNLLDAAVAGIFMAMMAAIFLLSVWEWIQLWTRRRAAVLRETEPVWLPEYALAEGRPMNAAGVAAVGFALLKELSGEAQLEREKASSECIYQPQGAQKQADVNVYLASTERRFKGVRRCC